MPNHIKILMLFLLSSIISSCGSTSGSTTTAYPFEIAPVSTSIVYNYVTPGNGLSDISYNETITLSGVTMNVTRNGGVQVNSGAWTINLNQSEIAAINSLLSLEDNQAVKDGISDTILYDGQNSSLLIGDSKMFHQGMVIDLTSNKNQLHQFPMEVTTLISNIENLMIAYSGDRYK